MTRPTGDTSSTSMTYLTELAIRTHYILKELREVGVTGKKVDFLYVSTGVCFSSFELTLPQLRR